MQYVPGFPCFFKGWITFRCMYISCFWGFPGGLAAKNPLTMKEMQYRRRGRHWLHLWVRKVPWRKKWQPIPVFFLGKSHGSRSLGAAVHRVSKRHNWAHWPITLFNSLSVSGHLGDFYYLAIENNVAMNKSEQQHLLKQRELHGYSYRGRHEHTHNWAVCTYIFTEGDPDIPCLWLYLRANWLF